MASDYSSLVSKVWNYAHVLRDQGISYGDYVEQITFLLFLKMDRNAVSTWASRPSFPPSIAGKSWRSSPAMSWSCNTVTL